MSLSSLRFVTSIRVVAHLTSIATASMPSLLSKRKTTSDYMCCDGASEQYEIEVFWPVSDIQISQRMIWSANEIIPLVLMDPYDHTNLASDLSDYNVHVM